jgi:hypothetical protein
MLNKLKYKQTLKRLIRVGRQMKRTLMLKHVVVLSRVRDRSHQHAQNVVVVAVVVVGSSSRSESKESLEMSKRPNKYNSKNQKPKTNKQTISGYLLGPDIELVPEALGPLLVRNVEVISRFVVGEGEFALSERQTHVNAFRVLFRRSRREHKCRVKKKKEPKTKKKVESTNNK